MWAPVAATFVHAGMDYGRDPGENTGRLQGTIGVPFLHNPGLFCEPCFSSR